MQCAAAAAAPSSYFPRRREVVRNPSGVLFTNRVNLQKFRRKHNTSFHVRASMSIGNGRGFEGEESTSCTLGDEDAVIIVDHGSRRQESNLMLNEFVLMFKGRTGYQIVEPAHMELAKPSIGDAFRLCVQKGAKRIIVSPFFLFPGRHWHQDIPSLVAEAAKEHSGISYIITAPLGLHELMVDVVNDRIRQCLSHVTGNADECAVCAGTGKCREYGPS